MGNMLYVLVLRAVMFVLVCASDVSVGRARSSEREIERIASKSQESIRLEAEALKRCGDTNSIKNSIEPYMPEIQDISESSKKKVDEYKEEMADITMRHAQEDQKHISGGVEVNERRLVFISLSQNKSNLEWILKQARVYRFTPVMRGFKDGSYIATVRFLGEIIKRTGYGVLIDPEAFKEFDVKIVPTFVIAYDNKGCKNEESCKTKKFHKVSGNVSFDHVIRLFEGSGDGR
ncbi:type-F conjugative transfer system pilin assembly protein TrbC [Rickettsiales endosymbiont of Peranema trichophorum]|uniref:type-F conjugative transfer system pilin assembly protein TrbC n=1 Tax=Rickettsiales endosymbiont of Peranema trichophorum TaxID=2486577 RepID=UPI001022AC00|nr:type-F conjugative transfer system pilin assembly protein TrbC [Rickettsiales endosymbiont of Peranema trichophorum]RZI47495.1 type-F conjugative transfer system pilin assembly protein TrbC [Rickettsiales endosymbiont of Peranema trichophorum]